MEQSRKRLPVLNEHLLLRYVAFSYAKGNFTASSDIDLLGEKKLCKIVKSSVR
ncbi:MAG: hypothetical protein IMHGJWDQ_000958 [Candidatus Fervidibacter sp.]